LKTQWNTWTVSVRNIWICSTKSKRSIKKLKNMSVILRDKSKYRSRWDRVIREKMISWCFWSLVCMSIIKFISIIQKSNNCLNNMMLRQTKSLLYPLSKNIPRNTAPKHWNLLFKAQSDQLVWFFLHQIRKIIRNW